MNSESEPSLLDYLKVKYNPFSKGTIEIPESEDEAIILPEITTQEKAIVSSISLPYRTLAAVISAVIAQQSLEPSAVRGYFPAIVFYIISITLFVLASKKGEWNKSILSLPNHTSAETPIDSFSPQQIRLFPIALLFGGITFILFKTLAFNFINIIFWIATILLLFTAFWEGSLDTSKIKTIFLNTINAKEIKISRSHLVFIAIFLLGMWMRTSQISTLPLEMTSDHAEIITDVFEILDGEKKIYFSGNTGREALPIYIAAKMASQIGIANIFLALKLGAALISGLTLIFVFLIGKEIANHRVGLISMGLIGIGYWPLVIARSTQGFETAPLIWSIVFYLLLRAFKGNNRNNFLLAGFFVGLGLYSYAAFNIVPLILLIIFLIAILSIKNEAIKWHWFYGFLMVTIMAIAVTIPIIRYAFDNPEIYGYRMLTRMTSLERTIEGSSSIIFLKNLWHAVTMTSWNGGGTWTYSVADRPALDVITGAFYTLGVIYLLFQIFVNKSKKAILLLGSVPLLMLPSALAIAFPVENPSLSRAGMAMIPIFVIAAIVFDKIWCALKSQKNQISKNISLVFLTGLLGLSLLQNHSLVFTQYAENYQSNARNTYEIGQVVKSFIQMTGETDTNFSVVYPHWADTRLIMINAGFPGLDNAIDLDQVEQTLSDPRLKLFLLHPDHLEGINKLTSLYPNGWWQHYTSNVEKDFILFYAPANQ